MRNDVIALNEGDRVKGLYRGVNYSGAVKSVEFNQKRRSVYAVIVLDAEMSGTRIMTRRAGELLTVEHGAAHNTVEKA